MRVAVCDDLPAVLQEAKDLLVQIEFVKVIHLYSDMEVFWGTLEDVPYDAVLLDIDWKQEKTGIDFAAELKKKSPETRIIYMTAYTTEYVEDIFLNSANLSGFLMKPLKLDQLIKNLEKVRQKKQTTEGKLTIQLRGNIIRIPMHEIQFVENQLHKVKIVLQSGEYICNERLEQIKERLDERFLTCHKSYVVNMDRIQEFKNSEILLSDGKVIPVSKARHSEAKKQFFSYVSESI